MYILFNGDNVVLEIVPDEDPALPGVQISDRYTPEFVARLTHFDDDVEVEQNWVYDPDTGTFSPPATSPEPDGVVATADLDRAYKEGVNSYE